MDKRITYLLNQYYRGVASEAEKEELMEEVRKGEADGAILSFMDDSWQHEVQFELTENQSDKILRQIINKQGGVVKMRKRNSGLWRLNPPSPTLWRIMAAAAVIGFVVWSLVFVLRQAQDDGTLRQAQNGPSINSGHDVKAPEMNRAMITLGDGRQVYLDQVGNGSLANVSGVEVIKEADGKIVYRESSSVNRDASTVLSMTYNTLTNPRGSKVIDITLSDGSRVWLNAGSSLRYPVVFNGDKREVELEGEGYFEIRRIKYRTDEQGISNDEGMRKIPFLVRSGEIVTEVLGTQFNVNAYEDEGEVRVTLLEGSVSVTPMAIGGESVKLVPGQSAVARVMNDKAIQVVNNVDTEAVMAWKNGLFNFKGSNVKSVMRQISRWYNVEIEYKGDVSEINFYGIISRKQNVSGILRVLEKTGIVYFEVDGNKIVVSKK